MSLAILAVSRYQAIIRILDPSPMTVKDDAIGDRWVKTSIAYSLPLSFHRVEALSFMPSEAGKCIRSSTRSLLPDHPHLWRPLCLVTYRQSYQLTQPRSLIRSSGSMGPLGRPLGRRRRRQTNPRCFHRAAAAPAAGEALGRRLPVSPPPSCPGGTSGQAVWYAPARSDRRRQRRINSRRKGGTEGDWAG